eukprot:jgi/Mesvir1/6682/Mv08909-RA.1
MMYTAMWSDEECLKYLLKYPYIVGFPVSSMFTSCSLLFIGTCLYFSIAGNDCMWIIAAMGVVAVTRNVLGFWRDLARYQNSDIPEEERQRRKRVKEIETAAGRTFLAWWCPWFFPDKNAVRDIQQVSSGFQSSPGSIRGLGSK